MPLFWGGWGGGGGGVENLTWRDVRRRGGGYLFEGMCDGGVTRGEVGGGGHFWGVSV